MNLGHKLMLNGEATKKSSSPDVEDEAGDQQDEVEELDPDAEVRCQQDREKRGRGKSAR